jgi:hypothetical protein
MMNEHDAAQCDGFNAQRPSPTVTCHSANHLSSIEIHMNGRLLLRSEEGDVNGRTCEGNRAPAGVRFPPKQEAAGRER